MTPQRKTVLISGASSGIGDVTARELARRGFRVFAGVRNPADAARIAGAAGPACTPLLLDITDAASIADAAATLRSAGGLYGLVNNAGIAVAGPLEFLPIGDVREQFEVNVFGTLALTQAVLPLLRRSLGRIVNVGSIAGRTPFPIVGPYGASKAALDVLTHTLRMELAPFDIGVSYVEPGAHRTPIWARTRAQADARLDALPPLARTYYGGTIAAVRALTAQAERYGDDPRRVAFAIARALESERPRARYTIGRDTRARALLALVPAPLKERLLDLRLRAIARA